MIQQVSVREYFRIPGCDSITCDYCGYPGLDEQDEYDRSRYVYLRDDADGLVYCSGHCARAHAALQAAREVRRDS